LSASPLREGRGGLVLAVRVTPKSSRDEITGLHVGADGAVALAVRVSPPPDKGKANKAVIEVVAKAARLPKSAISLIGGETDRHKHLLVTGNPAVLQALIATFQNQAG
jgi:uncharacterized protein (TIGR00251 family)